MSDPTQALKAAEARAIAARVDLETAHAAVRKASNDLTEAESEVQRLRREVASK